MNPWFGLSLMNEALCFRLAETLLHFLWQGMAIGLVMWLVNTLVPRVRSTLRYRLNALALFLMVVSVSLTLALLPAHEIAPAQAASTVSPRVAETSPVPESLPSTDEPADRPLDPLPVVSSQTPERIVEASVDASDPLPVSPAVTTQTEKTNAAESTYLSRMKSIAPYATTVYVLGVMIMLLRLLMGIRGGQRLRTAASAIEDSTLLESVRHLAQQIGLKVAPVVATCSRIAVPVVVGIVKPMILLPPSLVSSMSPAQLEAVLSHELAHLRRFDLVVNLLQRLIEALLVTSVVLFSR